jgi:mannose-6-phosphate isomerase-like protein (cupin superfamily)
VRRLATNDLVAVPPMTWHQFRATGDEPLGFLCMVNTTRDKPQLPTSDEVTAMQRDEIVKGFLQGERPS